MVQYRPVMETFWFGVKLAFGLAVGFGIVLVLGREVFGFIFTSRFTRAGCTYQKGEKPGTPSGWLTRDPRASDWLLWDEAHGLCLRLSAGDFSTWDEQRIRAWAAQRGIPLDSDFRDRIWHDSITWQTSNESLDQFLALAREYEELLQREPTPKNSK